MNIASSIVAQVIWQSPDLAPLAVAVLAVVVMAVLWLYPPQMDGVPAGWRWVLPGLRTFAVVALAIAILQPIALRPRAASAPGAIALLVDRSRSMAVVDQDRSPAELVALAAGIGALPASARREAAPGVRGQLEAVRSEIDQLTRARSEAEYARLAGRGAAAAGARLRESVEGLRAALNAIVPPPDSPQLTDRLNELKQTPLTDEPGLRTLRTKLEEVNRALDESQAQTDARLFQENENIQQICAALSSKSRASLVEAALLHRPDGLLSDAPSGDALYAFAFAADLQPLPLPTEDRTSLRLDVTGASTDIAGAIRGALQRTSARSVQAIVLLSDGRQVGGDAEGITSEVTSAGVPIIAIGTAAAGVRKDVSVVRVDTPASARIGESIAVHAELRGLGVRDTEVEVRLDAENVRQVRRVTMGDDGTAAGVDFDVVFSRSGPQPLTVTVTPLGGESSDENNRFVRWVKVSSDPLRVTVLAGPTAGRQYSSLHDALSRAPWIALREEDGASLEGVSPSSLLGQDVVILCDVPAWSMSQAQWAAVEQLVRERGGTVIICAGQSAPTDYTARAEAVPLLPYDFGVRPQWQTWPGGGPHFRIGPAPEVDLRAAGEEDDFWAQLPIVSRYMPLGPLRSGARTLLIEHDSDAPVLTEVRRGLGRSIFVGIDQTWRWRGPSGGPEREQFWPRLLRIVAPAPYVATKGATSLDVDHVAPPPNQPVSVRARVLDSWGEPSAAMSQTLQILQGGQWIRNVMLSPIAAGSGLYQGTIPELREGEYVLRLESPVDPVQEASTPRAEVTIRVAPRYEAELADISGNDRFLRRLADASGGQFLTLDQLNSLPRRLQENRDKQSRLVEYPLWDSPYLFGLVLASLSAEWALRKKFGLA